MTTSAPHPTNLFSRRRLDPRDLPRNHHGNPVAPLTPAGQPYRLCWHDTDHGELVYTATADDLLDEWMPGYLDLDTEQRMLARAQHALQVRAGLLAQIAASTSNLHQDIERLLLADADDPQLLQLQRWDDPTPLVLLDTLYRPYTDRSAPISGPDGDVRDPSNILWLRPAQAEAYITSLAHAGVIQLDIHPG